jgi:hypothetical protein
LIVEEPIPFKIGIIKAKFFEFPKKSRSDGEGGEREVNLNSRKISEILNSIKKNSKFLSETFFKAKLLFTALFFLELILEEIF